MPRTLKKKNRLSKRSVDVIERLMTIVEDMSYNSEKSFDTAYLVGLGEARWLFTFFRYLNLIDKQNKWIGPNVKDLIDSNHYREFIKSLYERRQAYISGEEIVKKEEKPDIPGVVPESVVSGTSNINVPLIKIDNDGVIIIEVGKFKHRYLINTEEARSVVYEFA